MEILILIIMGYIFLSVLKARRGKQYKQYKEQWILNSCSKGQHFVGIMPGLCEACGEQAKLLKNGGWRFAPHPKKEEENG